MKDMATHIDVVTSIEADDALAADNTEVTVDRSGYESVTYVIQSGDGGITFDGSNKIEFKLTHSDDDVTYTAVTVDDVIGAEGGAVGTGGIVLTFDEARTADCYVLGYVGHKRYTQLLADFSGTHGTGTPIAAVAILGNPHLAPYVA